MAVTVCTGWHPPAWRHYARRFIETFAERWPADIKLVAYTEEPVDLIRGECRDLWSIPGARQFYEVHSKIPTHRGAAPVPQWRQKDRRKGYAWRWDAVRFFKQCIIPNAAAQELHEDDILVWLDADIVTFADVPSDLVEKLLGRADLCYLGRNKGSEIGFWAVRLNARGRQFLTKLSEAYLLDWVFVLPQWHSAFCFDQLRQNAERDGLKVKNLTPGGRDHVWMQCKPLMECTDHLKGDRKNYGHSPEHPLRWWENK